MFNTIQKATLPEGALLSRYTTVDGKAGYTDCYCVVIAQDIQLIEYIEAFYGSHLFKIERIILAAIGKSSTNLSIARLARGVTNKFAAWHVEERDDDQILLSDFRQKTRSWLMVETVKGTDQTILYFGSAIVAAKGDSKFKKPTFGFTLLSKFHVLYSKALLSAAYRKLTNDVSL